ncbi:hypothetical protein BD408DRAFT_423608 [Parasitella parasitica]|nr:hypothetical protein BD408DRAFT_423608 [Parasitella parasitica]
MTYGKTGFVRTAQLTSQIGELRQYHTILSGESIEVTSANPKLSFRYGQDENIINISSIKKADKFSKIYKYNTSIIKVS